MTSPDPTETVIILRSDFEMLQKVADFAVEDAQALAGLLALPCPEGRAPREHFYTVLMPRIAALLTTQMHADAASEQISAAKARYNTEIDLPDGRKAALVGKKIPGLLSGLQPASRRERRELERDARRPR